MHKDAVKFLADVEEGKNFGLHMGCRLKSLEELNEALDIMAERTFTHHVNNKKNDFAIWIRETVGDKEFADKIGPIRTRDKMKHALSKRVDELKKIKSGGELNSSQFMKTGITDFIVGVVIGFILGLIVVSLV